MNPDKKRLYLDIDGVLLTTKLTRPANYVIEFIDYILDHFDCYWLTTHCNGNSNTAITYLSKYFDVSALQKLKQIKPAHWYSLKTEVFDFTTDFIWLEDYPFLAEISVLKTNKALNNLIIIDLNRKDELKNVIAKLVTHLK